MPRQQPMIILHNKSRRAICSQHKRNFLENVMFRCSLVLTRAVIDPIRLSESSRLMKSYQGQKGISLPWAWHRSAPACYSILSYFISFHFFLSKPQLNPNSTQPNITLSWVRHENDFAYHPATHHRNSMSAISQLLLTRFWWNFKCMFLGTSITDIKP